MAATLKVGSGISSGLLSGDSRVTLPVTARAHSAAASKTLLSLSSTSKNVPAPPKVPAAKTKGNAADLKAVQAAALPSFGPLIDIGANFKGTVAVLAEMYTR
jgi:hypothetical protein